MATLGLKELNELTLTEFCIFTEHGRYTTSACVHILTVSSLDTSKIHSALNYMETEET